MSSFDPLSYLNNQPTKYPMMIIADRAPTVNDQFSAGTRWQHLNGSTNVIYESEGAGVWNVGGAPAASETEAGLMEYATDAETLALTATDKAVRPSNLGALDATTTQRGIGEIATDAEAQGETISTNKFLVPSNLSALKNSTNTTWKADPVLQAIANTGAAPVGTDTATNIMQCQEGEVRYIYNIGTQTIIAPRMEAEGLLVSLDQTDNEGCEINFGVLTNSKHAYTIGTSPAFYCQYEFTLADVTGCDPVGIGFRKQEANNSVLESYTDFAWIGVSESDTTAVVSLKTRLNSGSVTTTNTTDAWADGETHTLAVFVDGSGNVTYTIDGVAPTATAAFQFDTGDVVMPFFHGLHGTTAPGDWHLVSEKIGLQ